MLGSRLAGGSTKSTMLGIGWHHRFINIGYIHNMYFEEYSKINQGVHDINIILQFGNNTKQKVKQISELENQELLKEINLANQLQKEAEVLARQEELKKETEELARRQDQLKKELKELKESDKKEAGEKIVKQTLNHSTHKITEETGLRIKASFSSEILERLSVGKKVLLLEKTSRYWWMVDHDGKIGYVKA